MYASVASCRSLKYQLLLCNPEIRGRKVQIKIYCILDIDKPDSEFKIPPYSNKILSKSIFLKNKETNKYNGFDCSLMGWPWGKSASYVVKCILNVSFSVPSKRIVENRMKGIKLFHWPDSELESGSGWLILAPLTDFYTEFLMTWDLRLRQHRIRPGPDWRHSIPTKKLPKSNKKLNQIKIFLSHIIWIHRSNIVIARMLNIFNRYSLHGVDWFHGILMLRLK